MTVQLKAVGRAKSISVAEEVFDLPFNEGLVHQSVVSYLANARTASANKKSRSEVRGGGAKPWRQKGTGRARAGTIRSPLWIGGGVTFAPKNVNFKQKVNKKMYKKSIKCILSELVRTETLRVFKGLDIKEPKTKAFLSAVEGWKLEGRSLLIFESVNENVYLASRNLENIDIIDTTSVNPYMFLCYENVLIDEAAVKKLEEILK